MSVSEVPVPEEDSPAPVTGPAAVAAQRDFFAEMCRTHDTLAAVLAILLPPKVTASVDLDKIRPLTLQLAEPSPAFRETDVLCEAPLKVPLRPRKLSDGSLATEWMIFDAQLQATPVEDMGDRVDNSVTLIHDAYLLQKGETDQAQDNEQEEEKAPHVFPLVIYPGEDNKRWERVLMVPEQIVAQAEPWVPLWRNQYFLSSLQDVPEEQIRDRTASPAAQLTVLLLKIVPGSCHLDRELKPWLRQLAAIRDRPGGEAEIACIIRYIRSNSETAASQVLALLGPQMEEEFMSTISTARDEAKAEAHLETRAEALLEVLAGKFGEVGFLPARWVRRWRRRS